MKKTLFVLLFFCSAAAFGKNVKGGKCEAGINGIKIKYVYIMGDQYNGVVWAYKHLAEETCFTPTTDISKADAILELRPPEHARLPNDPTSISVNCISGPNVESCWDSSGNLMRTTCDRGSCSSYYGPDPIIGLLSSLHDWFDRRSWLSVAYLYTPDYHLLWDSNHQKTRWVESLWYDKLRVGTNSPTCEVGMWHSRHGIETYRKLAIKRCKVEFDPLVSIDIKRQMQQESSQGTEPAAQ